MKTKLFYLLIPILLSINSIGQNLVPNYSFEDTIKCPDAYFYFQGYVSNWGGIEPGYFSPFCNDGGLGGMPSNAFGYQYPHTGNAYVGIYTFVDAGKDSTTPTYKASHNLRDYLQVQLQSILVPGTKYYTTVYVSLGDSFKYACNDLGVCFSDSALNLSSRRVLSYHVPQIINDTSHNLLTGKINWKKISGSFIANGGENYMIIGDFNNDKHVDTLNTDTIGYPIHQWLASYYFIDDVIVSPDSNYADSVITATQNVNKPKEELVIFPNPSNGKFTIQSSVVSGNSLVEIYNELGQKVYSSTLQQAQGDNQIDLSKEPSGIYLYRVTVEQGVLLGSGKIMKE